MVEVVKRKFNDLVNRNCGKNVFEVLAIFFNGTVALFVKEIIIQILLNCILNRNWFSIKFNHMSISHKSSFISCHPYLRAPQPPRGETKAVICVTYLEQIMGTETADYYRLIER